MAILSQNINILEPPIQNVAPFSSELIYSQYVAWRGCLNTRQIVTFWAYLIRIRHICSFSPLIEALLKSENTKI